MERPLRELPAGAMTRRSALLALSATMLSPALMGQQTRPVIGTRRLNNVMIAVSDVNRSAAFYEKLFGPPVRQGETVIFYIGGGPDFFAITVGIKGVEPGHLSCRITVAGFRAQRTLLIT